MKILRFIALLPLLLASCSSDSGQKPTTPQPTGARVLSPDDWLAEKSKDNGFTQDASGNMVPKANKRSSFENKGESNFANKDFKKQEYKAGDYAKKSWWGNKEYAPKAYAGNTDGSRFQKSSSMDGKGAREAATNAKVPDKYDTNSYATSSAREAGNSPIQKSSNAEIENRQKVFDQPEIIDWREQRSITMDQQKGILGR